MAQRGLQPLPQAYDARRRRPRQDRPPVGPHRAAQVAGREERLGGDPVAGDRGGEPVGPGGEQLLAEQPTQPVELGAQCRGAAIVLVEQDGQLVAGQPGRGRGQQHRELGVPRAQAQGGQAPPTVVDGEQRLAAAEGLQQQPDPSGARWGRTGRELVAGELGLGHPRRRAHHRQRLRHHHLVAAGDVQDAQQLAGRRVVDRGGRARPGLDTGAEVLGAGDRGGATGGQGQAGCVGAGHPLVPVAALDEPDRLGPAQGAGGAAHPQQLPGGVTDGHHRVDVAHGLAEHVVEEREDTGQGVRLPQAAQVGLLDRHRRLGGVARDAGGGGALPGLGDLGAHGAAGGPSGHEISRHRGGAPRQGTV